MSGYLHTAAKGAAAELLACAYLLRLGYHVYRCQAASAPFDLAAYHDETGEFIRVEVKSIANATTKSGPSIQRAKNTCWDLMLAVDCDAQRCFEIRPTTIDEDTAAVRAAYGFPPVRPYRSTAAKQRSALTGSVAPGKVAAA